MIVVEERGNTIEVREVQRADICEAVYALVQLIPIGYVTSYKSVGEALNVESRVVALCLKGNRTPIIVPCHRVVHSSRELGGYRRLGRAFKARLLELEGVAFDEEGRVQLNCVVDMKALLNRGP